MANKTNITRSLFENYCRYHKLARPVRDGWHTIEGRTVYTENGYILRGIILDRNRQQVPAHVYRATRDGYWNIEYWLSVDAFRSGVRRGTIDLM